MLSFMPIIDIQMAGLNSMTGGSLFDVAPIMCRGLCLTLIL